MSTVYHCSPTNSTFFTTCCHVAITDSEANCPRCKEEVTPRSHRGRWEVAHGPARRAREAQMRRMNASTAGEKA